MSEFNAVRSYESNDQAEPAINVDPKEARSYLAEGDEFVGDLKVGCGIRVAGRLVGSLEAKSGVIVIEKTGAVTGGIRGPGGIFIDGKVGGEDGAQVEIYSPATVTLMNNCVVNADISYGRLATFGDMTHNGASKKIRNA